MNQLADQQSDLKHQQVNNAPQLPDNIDWDRYVVHQIQGSRKSIHEAYGLWIHKTLRNMKSKAREELNPRMLNSFFSLSHQVKGEATYYGSDGKVTTIPKGGGILICPGFVHDYPGIQELFVEDSICFCGPVANHLWESGILSNGVIEIGNERRLLPIIDMAMDPSVDSQIQANLALQNLLVHLYLENRGAKQRSASARIDPLIEEIRRTPERWWTVENMAEFCNLSESRFRIVFKKAIGMSPKHYLDQFKIGLAAEQLLTTHHPAGDIAKWLGYTDVFHFSRRFKAIIGCSPTLYREKGHL
jgi:AraC-like DNA-binding protein